LQDHSDEDISRFWTEALEFIHQGIMENTAVLVHCRQGISRSATIVLAYLMNYATHVAHASDLQPVPVLTVGTTPPQSPTSYSDAFDYVKSRRPHISPNLGFVLALHEIDRQRGIVVGGC